MRTFIISLMLLWTAAINAETEQYIPLQCFPLNPFLERFKETYREELVFMSGSVNAKDEELFHQLWMNPSNQTWTFMVTNKPRKMVCIIASGQGFADLREIGI